MVWHGKGRWPVQYKLAVCWTEAKRDGGLLRWRNEPYRGVMCFVKTVELVLCWPLCILMIMIMMMNDVAIADQLPNAAGGSTKGPE